MTKQQIIDELCERFEERRREENGQRPSWDVLRELLSEAVFVYGDHNEGDLAMWQLDEGESDTHCGLLIGITPISQAVKKSEILEFLRTPPSMVLRYSPKELADRIEKWGVE